MEHIGSRLQSLNDPGVNNARLVSTRAGAKVYYVSVVNGVINERVMEPEMI